MKITFDRFAMFAVACIFLTGISVGLYSVIRSGVEIYKAYVLSPTWESTLGVVEHSQVFKGCGKGGRNYYLDVSYTYQVNLSKYINNKVSFGDAFCSGKSDAESMASQFPAGKAIPVFFNPTTPGDSVLLRGDVPSGTVPLTLFMFSFFVGLPVFLVKAAIDRKRERLAKTNTSIKSGVQQ